MQYSTSSTHSVKTITGKRSCKNLLQDLNCKKKKKKKKDVSVADLFTDVKRVNEKIKVGNRAGV